MDAMLARTDQPIGEQGEPRNVELPILARAPQWVRARRFVACAVGRQGLYLVTTDPAAAGTLLELEIPRAGLPSITARATVHACYGPRAKSPGSAPAGWCVRFDDLDAARWRELELLLDELELRDFLPVAKPSAPAPATQRAAAHPPSLLRIFGDLAGDPVVTPVGATALDPLDFRRPRR